MIHDRKTIQVKIAALLATHPIAGFILLTCMFTTPALRAQQDVHATLIPLANRKPAPAFQLLTDTGAKIKTTDYRGKVLLMNFWATDCGGCVLEIPSFIKLENAYKNKDFTALGVSMDISYENLKDAAEAWGRVRPFVAKHGVNYPIAMGDDAISRAYALSSFPATYLIDKNGNVAVSYVGVLIDEATVAKNIDKLLTEK